MGRSLGLNFSALPVRDLKPEVPCLQVMRAPFELGHSWRAVVSNAGVQHDDYFRCWSLLPRLALLRVSEPITFLPFLLAAVQIRFGSQCSLGAPLTCPPRF